MSDAKGDLQFLSNNKLRLYVSLKIYFLVFRKNSIVVECFIVLLNIEYAIYIERAILELPLITEGEELRAKSPSGKLVCRNVRKKRELVG